MGFQEVKFKKIRGVLKAVALGGSCFHIGQNSAPGNSSKLPIEHFLQSVALAASVPNKQILVMIPYMHLFSRFRSDDFPWETIQTGTDFVLGGSIITADGDCIHEIKRCLPLGRKVMTDLDSILKRRDITLPTRSV